MFSSKTAKFSVALSRRAPVLLWCGLSSPHFSPGNGLWRTAHCISYKHLLHGCSCRGPLQRISSSHCLSLSWELDPGFHEWETFTARLPVPSCFVHKADVIPACGEAGMCWKPKFTLVKCWPWTGRIPAKPDVLGNCILAVVNFVLLFYFWWSALGYLSPKFHSSEKNLSKQ